MYNNKQKANICFVKKVFTILFFFITIKCNAQIGNNWFFGDKAALNFNQIGNSFIPTVLPTNALKSEEGCVSISDNNGDLLFYSNGASIYNRNHTLMLNGNNLNGNTSALQSCIVVPHPGNSNLYYLFTTDAYETNFQNGYQYSIIDMQRDNALGEVVSKNVLLNSSCTERLAAIQHQNGIDVWLVTNDKSSNIFRSWLITCNGLQPNPVVSTVGEVLNVNNEMNIGVLMASPNGKKICQTNFANVSVNVQNHFFQLFDFDNNTGILSNSKKIFLNRFTFGCAFSPNSNFLYLTDPDAQKFVQVECNLSTSIAIRNSVVAIDCGFGLHGIQLAPDLKLYLSRKNKNQIAVINHPNLKGTLCNYRDTMFSFNQNQLLVNLPQFINNTFFDPTNGFDFSIIDSCIGKVQFNGISNLPGPISYEWNFGDGFTSNAQNPIHTYVNPNRQYLVKLIIYAPNACSNIRKSFILIPQGMIIKNDFDFNFSCDSGKAVFLNKTFTEPLLTNYNWNFADNNTSTLTNPIHYYIAKRSYPVSLSIAGVSGCINVPKVKQVVYDSIYVSTLPDFTINVNESKLLTTTSNGTIINWTPSLYLNNVNALSPTTKPLNNIRYIVKAQNNEGCVGYDTLHISVTPIDEVFVPSIFTPNGDGINDLFQPFFDRRYTKVIFEIYDRWGNKIFVGNAQNDYMWNGKNITKNIPTTSLVWIFSAVKRDGTIVNKKGTVILLR